MPGDIKTTVTNDEYRLRNHRAQVSNRHDVELREMEKKHAEDTLRLQELFTGEQEKLRKDFDVEISREAEALEEKLHETKLQADARVAEEKRNADLELTKVKRATQLQIADYKKDSEARLDQLRKQYQASADNLHGKARKTAVNKDKEV